MPEVTDPSLLARLNQSTPSQGVVIPKAPDKPKEAPSGYQWTAGGNLAPIAGGPADPNAKEGAKPDAAYSQSALDAFDRAINTIDRLKVNKGFGAAVGSGFDPQSIGRYNPVTGEAFGGTQAAGFEAELASLKAQVFLPMVQSMKGMGALSNAEGEKLTASIGALDTKMPEADFKASLERIKSDLLAYKQRGIPKDGAQPTTPQPAPLQVAQGDKYSTDQDIAIASQLDSLWKSGASIDQLNAKSIELTGQPMSPEAIATLSSEGGRSVLIVPNKSGMKEAGGPGVGAAVASGMLGGFTGNMADELVGMVSPEAAQKLQAAQQYSEQEYMPVNIAGGIVGGVLSPLSRLPLGVGGTVAGEAMRGAAYGGISGAGSAPIGAPAMDRITSGALGATFGAGGGAIGGGLAQRAANRAATSEATQGAVAAADEVGIPVMTSDVFAPQTFMGKSAQFVTERIPFVGTGGVRAGQQQARTNAVTDLMTDYGVGDPTLAEKIFGSLSATRKAQIEKYSKIKGDVIGTLSSAGEVPLPNTMAAIDKEIADLSRVSEDLNAPAIGILNQWKNDLAGKSLQDIEALRKLVGEQFAKSDAVISGDAQKALNRIYGKVNEDMGAFIKQTGAPKDFVKWKIANKRLSEEAQELGKSALKSALRDGSQTPEKVLNLLFSQKPSDVAALYRNLGSQGRANARAAILDKAFRDMGGELDTISPEKFISTMRKSSNATRLFFNGEDAKRLTGLIEALKLTQRAGQSGVVTQSGVQTYLPTAIAALSDIFKTGGAAVGGAVTLGALARAYESAPVRNALMRVATTGEAGKGKAAQAAMGALKTAFSQAGGAVAPKPQTVEVGASQ